MNKNAINKAKLYVSVFLVVAVLAVIFVFLPRDAKADSPSISVYYHMTSDTTPIIKGTISDASASVSVVIIGYVDRTATVSGDGSWSLQLNSGETLPLGDYAVGAASVIGSETVSDSAYIYIDEEYPLEFYYESEEGSFMTSSIIFPDEYTYTSEENDFSITFSKGTTVTKTGGGIFNLAEWYAEGVDPGNERVISKLRFGVPDIELSFSQDVNITFNVGEEYEGQTLNLFSRGDGGNDEGWDPMEVSCDVADGNCSFDTSHASYFAISQNTSIAETEEGETSTNNDENDESEKADITSWKAYRYENNKGVSCKDRLVLEIKGKHFKKDSKVRIGDKKAFSVEKESSKKITAKFCLEDLLKVKTNRKRTVSVTNPDAEREKAKKKINLDDIDFGKFASDDFDAQTTEGIKNIQRALISLNFLDEQYVTGFYGPITTEAIRKFQEQNGLPTTGFFGPLTTSKLQENMK